MGGHNFFQNLDSSVLLNCGLWARVAGLHPVQTLRSQHMIVLKIPFALVRPLFITKLIFFDYGHVPVTARLGNNHIGKLLPFEMCSLLPENDHSN